MIKIIKKLLLVAFGLVAVFGCSDPDNAIYTVLDDKEYGAILRTVSRVNTNFNVFDLNSKFEIVVEEQDEKQGKLLSDVKVYLNYIDRQDDGVDNNKSNVLVSTFPASAFTEGPKGLPRATVAFTFSEAISALGFSAGQYSGGDVINVRLELNLTDGRSFSVAQASGSLQGSYFSSPYQYNAGILCIPPAPIAGDYVVDMQDSYGDGWQGSGVVVTIDGVETKVALPDLWTAGLGGSVGDAQYVSGSVTVTVPVGTQTLEWAWVSGDYPSECTYQIYTPSGALGAAGGPSPPVGGIALNLCNE